MPNKTIYIRESDKEAWEQAERLAPGSLSSLLSDFVKRFVRDRLGDPSGIGRIVVSVSNDDKQRLEHKAFYGEWLIAPSERLSSRETGCDPSVRWAVALTKKGNIAVYRWYEPEGETQEPPLATEPMAPTVVDADLNDPAAVDQWVRNQTEGAPSTVHVQWQEHKGQYFGRSLTPEEVRFEQSEKYRHVLLVFESLDHALASGVKADIVERARIELDPDHVEELDI